MTKAKMIAALIVGGVLVAALAAVHLAALPADATWRLNRVLHHLWQGAVGLAGVGGVVWTLWPRPKARRRDIQRDQAHRRVVVMVAFILAPVVLVALSEVHRDLLAGDRVFIRPAMADLEAVARAADAYAADHDGAAPESAAALAPDYLDREHLYYAFRDGPREGGAPAAEAAVDPDYALVREKPAPLDAEGQTRPRTRVRAYLKPGFSWAAQTVLIDRGGATHVVAHDVVAGFEAEREKQEEKKE